MNITPLEEEWIKENLSKIDFLKKLDPLQVSQLIHEITARNFGGAETIIQQGQSGDNFFLIFNGKVSVWVELNGKRVKLAQLERGDHFGEISLLSGKPAIATVIANKQTRVFFLKSQNFIDLVRENSELAAFITRIVETRLLERKTAADNILKGNPVEMILEIQRFLSGNQKN